MEQTPNNFTILKKKLQYLEIKKLSLKEKKKNSFFFFFLFAHSHSSLRLR